jgi:tetratricopeptide (TPR) repeat protein
MRSILCELFVFLLATTVLAAQSQKPDPAKPADLSLTAIGRQHHPIQTQSHEAQEYFDQGITLIYAFNHEEAARSFQRAAELDPASPMPLWGIALAVGPNYNMDVDAQREKQGYETIQKAEKLAANSPQVEKDYVAALLTRYSGDTNPDYKKLSHDYASAMKALSTQYPDDLDAATLYAESLMDLNPWKLWSLDGKPGQNTGEIVTVLESVLARDPNHAGANHYYIHAVEASPDPSRALPSAHRLDTLVPEAGHLVHMPAHIYERTGYYEQAAKTNAQAAKTGTMYDMMYHSHNEHFEAMAASMAGHYAEAKQAADTMAARLLPHAAVMPMLDPFLMTPIWVDARFSKWPEILARPEPAKQLTGTHTMWRYSRAIAFASTGKVPEAEKEFALFNSEVGAIPEGMILGDQNKASDVFSVAGHVIEGRIAIARGNKDEASIHLQKAVAIQDTLKYAEPADWYYPVRESLGASLLASGKATEAEQVFREDLKQNPRNPRSLYGLMEALRAQKKEADAAWVEKELNAAWKNADTKLTLLIM